MADCYHAWSAMRGAEQERALSDNGLLDAYFRLTDDAERSLAFVMLCAARFDEPDYLALIAAGPLEDILQPGVDRVILTRIADEARRTPRFRWMLGRVYPHAVDPIAAALVSESALAYSDDEFPPALPA
jgi:hypothetical protein